MKFGKVFEVKTNKTILATNKIPTWKHKTNLRPKVEKKKDKLIQNDYK